MSEGKKTKFLVGRRVYVEPLRELAIIVSGPTVSGQWRIVQEYEGTYFPENVLHVLEEKE